MATRFSRCARSSLQAAALWVALTAFCGVGCSLLPDQKEETKGWTEKPNFSSRQSKIE